MEQKLYKLICAPLKISEIIITLTSTALIRTLIGIIPAILLMSPLFDVSILDIGAPLFLLFLSLYMFGTTLGILVTSGLLRFGPSFENTVWSSLFFYLLLLGCVYYPITILPDWLQIISKFLPLVYIFEEARSILVNNDVNYINIMNALALNVFYFYISFCILLFFMGQEKRYFSKYGRVA